MINTEIRPETSRLGRLLRRQYQKGNLAREDHGVNLPPFMQNPRFKLALMLTAAFIAGSLPEFSIPGSARLNVFCFEENDQRRITIDATHLKNRIDQGSLSLVYQQNRSRGDLVVLFPYGNPEWRELELDLPYQTLESSPLEATIGDRIDLRQGFVTPGDVEKNQGILDSVVVTEDCLQR